MKAGLEWRTASYGAYENAVEYATKLKAYYQSNFSHCDEARTRCENLQKWITSVKTISLLISAPHAIKNVWRMQFIKEDEKVDLASGYSSSSHDFISEDKKLQSLEKAKTAITPPSSSLVLLSIFTSSPKDLDAEIERSGFSLPCSIL